ncbi:formate dehydrogenase accessory sulfurtransferase FdhD [Brevibacterium album]|uniref:formate dehydrogenase accessory sulfurtransferase FdhD n=1 Tax=Brevibacterium album TaxID=417948 RepID=UPI00048C2B36|nr:formate dehydrogenase accessory sulfurtransferase FdhD [Brevibacterium album]
MTRMTVRTRAHRFDANGLVRARADRLAGEEPLEVRLDGEQFTVTMRTPGSDVELVMGFLLTEGVITHRDQVREIDFSAGLDPDGSRNLNVAGVSLEPGTWDPVTYRQRQVYTSSACGICGTASIEAVQKVSRYPLGRLRPFVEPATLLGLPDALRAEQALFDSTGGVHAAGLFRIIDLPAAPDSAEALDAGEAPAGGGLSGAAGSEEEASAVPPPAPQQTELLCLREDVGRHNAVDKVLGWALKEDLLPLGDTVLQVSGRASFELVQKAAMAGIPVLSAVSAPSSLAVDLGQELGLTVVGFNRGRTFNAYSALERIRGR